MCRLSKIPGSLNLLEPEQPLEACRGTALLLPFDGTEESCGD